MIIISSPACLLILNFYTALDVPLLDFIYIERTKYFCTEKQRESG